MKCLAAVFLLTYLVTLKQTFAKQEESEPAWGYRCVDSRCQKVALEENDTAKEKAVSLPVCRMYCSEAFGTLWPRPTGDFHYGNDLVHINVYDIQWQWDKTHQALSRNWDSSVERFRGQLMKMLPSGTSLKTGGMRMIVKVSVAGDSLILNHRTDESYQLFIKVEESGEVTVHIVAANYFGARHGLETLAQMVVYDDIRNELQIMGEVEMKDSPAYPHRGVSIDTSRNYIDVGSIKRTIDTLAMVKMNVFHWHITDSHSWPLVINSHPVLHKYGAYSPREIYTAEDVADIVQYALVRGVRVIPELDAPAHVGEGWEKTNLTSCFNFQPWVKYCVEPPCGQLDPTKDKVYDILEDVYREMNAMFSQSDIFHMGGDEVSFSCWNSSVGIQQWMQGKGWGLDEASFLKLWNHFQTNALERLDKSLGDKRPIMMWTSHLTEEPYVDMYLDKERYIIQIWTTGNDPKLAALLQKGFKVIISNYDALYLDCGFGGWVTDGNNWCSPYIGWHKVYSNDLKAMGGAYSSQILGAEGALWMEQADQLTLDSRLWPRLSALAERLWSDPASTWQQADPRMLVHRERLVANGIGAESIQPKWCLQNEGDCPMDQSRY